MSSAPKIGSPLFKKAIHGIAVIGRLGGNSLERAAISGTDSTIIFI